MRRGRMLPFVIFVALGIALPALASDRQAAPKDPTVIKVTDSGFDPATLTIRRGDIVRWELQDGSSAHTIMSGTSEDEHAGDIFAFALNLEHKQQDVTFDKTGTFAYFASDNPQSLHGTITVSEATPVNLVTWGKIKNLFETP